jgi:hypothetical protein
VASGAVQEPKPIRIESLPTSVADPDPGSVAFFTPGSGMNNPDHISESLKSLMLIRDLGWKKY